MDHNDPPSLEATQHAGPGEPDSGPSVPRETNGESPFVSYRPRRYVPWWQLFSYTYLIFIILYQVSPEFQAWVNYNVRYWGRYPSYMTRYAAWWLRQVEE